MILQMKIGSKVKEGQAVVRRGWQKRLLVSNFIKQESPAQVNIFEIFNEHVFLEHSIRLLEGLRVS